MATCQARFDTCTSCSTQSTWTNWNQTDYTVAITGTTWLDWNTAYDTSVNTRSCSAVYASESTIYWQSWNNSYTDLRVVSVDDVIQEVREIRESISDEEMKRRNRKIAVQGMVREIGRKQAEAKAKDLARELLEPVQLERFEADNVIPLFKKDGRRFEIHKGIQENIYLVDEKGKKLKRYCVTLNSMGKSIPQFDYMIAQMLLLESNEEEFMKLARVHNIERVA